MSLTASADDRRPVVVRFAALGDVVLLTVLLETLSKRHVCPINVLSSGGWTRTLLEHDPAVAEIKLVKSRKTPYWLDATQREVVAWLRNKQGPVYLCDPDKAARRLVERAVPKERIIAVWDAWPGIDTHWADWWQSVGTGEPLIEGRGQPRLHLPDAWRADAQAWMRTRGIEGHPILLIQPGNKKTAKRFSWNRQNDKYWPTDRWAETIRAALETNGELRVIVCGTPREEPIVAEIVAATKDSRVLAAARDLPLPRLVALAEVAHSMISIDTGPAHVAAAMDCPLVVLFGRFGTKRWLARAPRSTVSPLGGTEDSEEATVRSISASDVIAAWRRLPPRGVSAP